jgi:endoglucanase
MLMGVLGMREWARIVAGTAAFGLLLAPVTPSRLASADTDAARAAARRFLERYVEPDGRVVRRDQGGDTVGEGQSYALVLALVADDPHTFRRVWGWTAASFLRDDGLLVHRMDAGGQIVDSNAATDADLVTAWALLRFGGGLRADGEALAAAILEHEVLELPEGNELLAAGQWATGAPGTLNPSYWALPLLDDLAARTGDDRWRGLAASSRAALETLTRDGTLLPPDWARVDGARVSPTPAPGGGVPDTRYSLDAQRILAWLATGNDEDRDLAATWWDRLDRPRASGAIALSPQGKVLVETRHPVALVASAAAASADGDDERAARLLDAASALDREAPTYYGAAWVALGRALLTTDFLSKDSS